MERKSKPNWWLVFAIVPLMIVAILVESQFKYPAGVHEVADCAIVIVSFGLVVGWMRSNESALEEEEIAKEHWVFMEEPSDDEALEYEIPVDPIPGTTHARSTKRKRTGAGRSTSDSMPIRGRYD